MAPVSIVPLGVVLSASGLAGCGPSDAPAAASALESPLKNLNVVRIPPDSPQLRQIHGESVQQADVPSAELVAPGRVTMNPNRVSRVLPPVGGRVLKVLVKFGDHVEQGQPLLTMDSPDGDAAVSAYLQAPLMTIADLSTVWVSSNVPEPFIPLVHVGEPVTITLVAFPDQTLAGRVARIGDVLDAQTRTLKVHVELPSPGGRFRPEMSAWRS
jgi:multidrug efflux pump subunit AcrA (membrane-fusion protein)